MSVDVEMSRTVPKDDDDYKEVKIESVRKNEGGGWVITRDDGWSFCVPESSPIEPKVGMIARFYPRVHGSVRGLFIGGRCVFYRTLDEHTAHELTQRFGADAQDWMSRWDKGQTVWSVEMGGLGPGYEQAIQIAVAEVLRHMLAVGYNATNWDDAESFKSAHRDMERWAFSNDRMLKLGLSGAQWSAAVGLASRFYRFGPVNVMREPHMKDRLIQVCARFPTID